MSLVPLLEGRDTKGLARVSRFWILWIWIQLFWIQFDWIFGLKQSKCGEFTFRLWIWIQARQVEKQWIHHPLLPIDPMLCKMVLLVLLLIFGYSWFPQYFF